MQLTRRMRKQRLQLLHHLRARSQLYHHTVRPALDQAALGSYWLAPSTAATAGDSSSAQEAGEVLSIDTYRRLLKVQYLPAGLTEDSLLLIHQDALPCMNIMLLPYDHPHLTWYHLTAISEPVSVVSEPDPVVLEPATTVPQPAATVSKSVSVVFELGLAVPESVPNVSVVEEEMGLVLLEVLQEVVVGVVQDIASSIYAEMLLEVYEGDYEYIPPLAQCVERMGYSVSYEQHGEETEARQALVLSHDRTQQRICVTYADEDRDLVWLDYEDAYLSWYRRGKPLYKRRLLGDATLTGSSKRHHHHHIGITTAEHVPATSHSSFVISSPTLYGDGLSQKARCVDIQTPRYPESRSITPAHHVHTGELPVELTAATVLEFSVLYGDELDSQRGQVVEVDRAQHRIMVALDGGETVPLDAHNPYVQWFRWGVPYIPPAKEEKIIQREGRDRRDREGSVKKSAARDSSLNLLEDHNDGYGDDDKDDNDDNDDDSNSEGEEDDQASSEEGDQCFET